MTSDDGMTRSELVSDYIESSKLAGISKMFDELCDGIHTDNVDRGFYDDANEIRAVMDAGFKYLEMPEERRNQLMDYFDDCALQAAIGRMHSELSEALEAIRHGNKRDEHCPDFRAAEIELADCVIRIMDTAGERGFLLGPAMIAKLLYNRTRPYKHGKKS